MCDTPLEIGLRLTTWRFGGIDRASEFSPGHKRATVFNVVAIGHTARISGVSKREADRATERGIWSNGRMELYPCVDHRALNTLLGQIQ